MTKKHGVNTVAVAEKLKLQLEKNPERYKDIRVFYDHGDSSKPEVCQPTAYMGRSYGNDATLAATDIVILNGSKVLLAIEIEEYSVRPKTVIGDIFSLVLADRIRIKGKPYSTEDLFIVVAVAASNKGKQSLKFKRLERHIDKYLKVFATNDVKKVRILTCPIDDMIRRIERLIRLEIGKSI